MGKVSGVHRPQVGSREMEWGWHHLRPMDESGRWGRNSTGLLQLGQPQDNLRLHFSQTSGAHPCPRLQPQALTVLPCSNAQDKQELLSPMGVTTYTNTIPEVVLIAALYCCMVVINFRSHQRFQFFSFFQIRAQLLLLSGHLVNSLPRAKEMETLGPAPSCSHRGDVGS